MEILELSEQLINNKLGRNIYDDTGRLLLPKGTVLQEAHINQLLNLGYSKILVGSDDEQSEEVYEPEGEKLAQKRLGQAFAVAVDSLRDLMAKVANGHPAVAGEVEETMEMLFPSVKETNNIMLTLRDLRRKDEYTLQHSVSVSVLATKLGQLMRLPGHDLRMLGTAGILHDIGKCKIPLAILNKNGSLSEQEFREMQKHPVYGYQIVKDMNLKDPRIMLAVLQHHEHQDGRGYPLKLSGGKIHLFSKIIAVADVFDAMTSERPYRGKMDLFNAMNEIFASSASHLNPEVVNKLRTYILSICPGASALLNNGDVARIILMNSDEPSRPLIQSGHEFIDLREQRDLWVRDIVI
jgi:putative nucleotidyltransferase with HDIG domain